MHIKIFNYIFLKFDFKNCCQVYQICTIKCNPASLPILPLSFAPYAFFFFLRDKMVGDTLIPSFIFYPSFYGHLFGSQTEKAVPLPPPLNGRWSDTAANMGLADALGPIFQP